MHQVVHAQSCVRVVLLGFFCFQQNDKKDNDMEPASLKERSLDKHLRLHDLAQAATLIAVGIPVADCEWRGDQLVFMFPDSTQTRKLLTELAAGEIQLDPLVVIDGFRRARRRLSEELRRAGGFER